MPSLRRSIYSWVILLRITVLLVSSLTVSGCVPTGDWELIKLKLGLTRPQDLTYLPRRAPSENPNFPIENNDAINDSPLVPINQGMPIINQDVEEKMKTSSSNVMSRAPLPVMVSSIQEKTHREAPVLHANLEQYDDFNEEDILGEEKDIKRGTKPKDFPVLSDIQKKEIWDEKKSEQEKEELNQLKEEIQKKKEHKKHIEKNDLVLSEPIMKAPMDAWSEKENRENKTEPILSYKTLKPPRDAFTPSVSPSEKKLRSLKPSRYGYKRSNPPYLAKRNSLSREK